MDAWHPRHTTPLQLDSEMHKGLPPTETFFGKRVGFNPHSPDEVAILSTLKTVFD